MRARPPKWELLRPTLATVSLLQALALVVQLRAASQTGAQPPVRLTSDRLHPARAPPVDRRQLVVRQLARLAHLSPIADPPARPARQSQQPQASQRHRRHQQQPPVAQEEAAGAAPSLADLLDAGGWSMAQANMSVDELARHTCPSDLDPIGGPLSGEQQRELVAHASALGYIKLTGPAPLAPTDQADSQAAQQQPSQQQVNPADQERVRSSIPSYCIFSGSATIEFITQVITPILFAIIVVVGLLGNIVVMTVILEDRKSERELTPTNLLVLDLSVADLSFIVFCIPFTGWDYAVGQWVFGWFWCKCTQYLIVVCALSSIYTLVLMSVDRFLAIVYPIECMPYRTNKNVLLAIEVKWLLILLIASPTIFMHGLIESSTSSEVASCRFLSDHYNPLHFQIIFFITSYLFPLILIFCLYLSLLRKLWYGAKPQGHRESLKMLESKKKVTLLVASIVVVFALCWFPIQIMLILMRMKSYKITATYITIQVFAHILGYMNSCVNPIVYAFASESFVNSFKRSTFGRLCYSCLGRPNAQQLQHHHQQQQQQTHTHLTNNQPSSRNNQHNFKQIYPNREQTKLQPRSCSFRATHAIATATSTATTPAATAAPSSSTSPAGANCLAFQCRSAGANLATTSLTGANQCSASATFDLQVMSPGDRQTQHFAPTPQAAGQHGESTHSPPDEDTSAARQICASNCCNVSTTSLLMTPTANRGANNGNSINDTSSSASSSSGGASNNNTATTTTTTDTSSRSGSSSSSCSNNNIRISSNDNPRQMESEIVVQPQIAPNGERRAPNTSNLHGNPPPTKDHSHQLSNDISGPNGKFRRLADGEDDATPTIRQQQQQQQQQLQQKQQPLHSQHHQLLQTTQIPIVPGHPIAANPLGPSSSGRAFSSSQLQPVILPPTACDSQPKQRLVAHVAQSGTQVSHRCEPDYR